MVRSTFATMFVSSALVCSAAFAQVQTGSILVKVLDEQRAVLPGATMTITSSALVKGAATGATDTLGVYRFPSLPPGTYGVRVELQGFQTLVREGVIVSVGQTTPLELVLRPASVSESVTVVGGSPVIDTTSANVNVTITQQLLQATPGGRDIWSLLEYKMPGLATNRPDVGGAAGGLQATFSARGTSDSQNTHFLNGINVGSPSAIGATSFYFDYDSFEEMQVSTGAHDLAVSSSGVFVNMVTKTGSDRFSGRTSLFWEGHQLQSQNVDKYLSDFGFADDAGAVDFISDANGQIGGPIIKNKLRFFGSYRDWRVHVGVPGFTELDSTNISTALGNVTFQMNDKNRFTGFVAQQWYKKPNRNASALLTPDSTFREDNHIGLVQGWWNSVFSKTAFMDARISFQDLLFQLFQKGAQQSLLDLSTNVRQLNATNTSISTRKRLQASANFYYYVDQALGGRHEFRWGVDNQHAPASATDGRLDDVNLTYRSQPTPVASTVQIFNTPLTSKQAVDVFALYAQDSYTVEHLTVTGGVRWERLEGYLPEQSSPPSAYFPNDPRSFSAIHNIIHWKNLAPRVSFVYDLGGRGKTALKASAGRYSYQIATGAVNSVNKNFTASETHTWNDLNGDLQFTPGELGGLLSRSGTNITSYDPEVKRPHTDELLVGIDHELFPALKVTAVYTYRRERDQYGSINVGIPFSTYRLVSRTDLGADGLLNTGDDGTINVWDQDPATRGQDRFVITNSTGLNQQYHGFETTATKRFGNGWQLLAGYTYARTIVNAIDISNPNGFINSRGSTFYDRPHTIKVSGSYTLPHDIAVSGNFRLQSGKPIARTATFALTQGNVTVNATEPGSDRLDPFITIDARIAKVFKVGKGQELEVMLDGYNLSNANTVWDVRTLTGRINVREGGDPTGALINQQQYRSPISILPPRIFRLGAAFRF